MKTLLIGYYGQGNAGDDAFVEVTHWGIHRHFGALDIVANSPSDLFTTQGRIQGLYGRKWFPGHNRIRYHLRTRKVDRLLFAGGSNFHSSNIAKWEKVLDQSRNNRIAGIGVSVGPFRNTDAEVVCKRLLGRFSYLGLRDQQSYERVKAMGLDIPFDLTFDLAVQMNSLVDFNQPESGNSGNLLGVSLCYYERYAGGELALEEARMRYVADVVRQSLEKGLFDGVVLIDFNRHPHYGDANIHHRMAELIGYSDAIQHHPYSGNPLELIKTVLRVRCMLSMRLHSAIFAYAAGIPFVMLPYHEKCREWARMINLPQRLQLTEQGAVTEGVLALEQTLRDWETSLVLPVDTAINASMENWRGLVKHEFFD